MFQGQATLRLFRFLKANRISDSAGNLTDLALTSSFNNFMLNPVDVTNGLTTGCAEGTPTRALGVFKVLQTFAALPSINGSPGTGMLALVGIGLLGFGVAFRRRKAQLIRRDA